MPTRRAFSRMVSVLGKRVSLLSRLSLLGLVVIIVHYGALRFVGCVEYVFSMLLVCMHIGGLRKKPHEKKTVPALLEFQLAFGHLELSSSHVGFVQTPYVHAQSIA